MNLQMKERMMRCFLTSCSAVLIGVFFLCSGVAASPSTVVLPQGYTAGSMIADTQTAVVPDFAINAAGSVFMADLSTDAVRTPDAEGTLSVFTEETALSSASSVAFGPSGNLYVTASNQTGELPNALYKVDVQGNAERLYTLQEAQGLAVDQNGTVYASSAVNGGIAVFPADKQAAPTIWAQDLPRIETLALSPNRGRIFACGPQDPNIFIVDITTGEVLDVLQGPSLQETVQALAFGHDGYLYAATAGDLYRSQSGSDQWSLFASGFDDVTDLGFSAHGDLLYSQGTTSVNPGMYFITGFPFTTLRVGVLQNGEPASGVNVVVRDMQRVCLGMQGTTDDQGVVEFRAASSEYEVRAGDVVQKVTVAGEESVNAVLEYSFSKDELCGWWYAPELEGTGLSLEIIQDVMFFCWYVFDESGRSVWYVSWLEKTDAGDWFGRLRRFHEEITTEGGRAPVQEDIGEVRFSFDSQTVGTFTWNIGGGDNQVGVIKYMQGEPDPRGLNGWYVSPDSAGTGWFVEARDNTLYLGWFYYRNDGTARWSTLGGWLDEGGFMQETVEYTGYLQEYSGGWSLGGTYTPPDFALGREVGIVITQNNGGYALTFQAGETIYELQRFDFSAGDPYLEEEDDGGPVKPINSGEEEVQDVE